MGNGAIGFVGRSVPVSLVKSIFEQTQIRYRYTDNGWQLTGSVLWQLQYLSAGPNGKSEEYIKNSCVPEVYLGVDYKKPGWQVGAGMEILSLVPRTQNEVDGKIYKVSERVSSVSGEAHVKYQDANWLVMAKTLLASNLTQTCMLGGYGVTSIDPRTDSGVSADPIVTLQLVSAITEVFPIFSYG